MLSTLVAFAGLLSLTVAEYGVKTGSFTPHVQFSSSIGVLGCKVNTNRIGYLPFEPDCNNMCYNVTNPANGVSVTILHVDKSGTAYDISADAFTYLVTGRDASAQNTVPIDPTTMHYQPVDMKDCYEHINTADYKMPIIAASPTKVTNCMANEPESWLANNYVLYNYMNSCCSVGYDDECEFPVPYYGGAQPVCPVGRPALATPELCGPQFDNIGLDGKGVEALC